MSIEPVTPRLVSLPGTTPERRQTSDEQIQRLADFIVKEYPAEPGLTGKSEGAVEVAIRLLSEPERAETLRRIHDGQQAAVAWRIAAGVADSDTEIEVIAAKLEHLSDLYAALGVKWGEDPFARIAYLLTMDENRDLTKDAPTLRIFHDVVKERARQTVTKGYDEAHDDAHSVAELTACIRDKLGKADLQALGAELGKPDHSMTEARRRLVQVVAVGVAAIESLDRKDPTLRPDSKAEVPHAG